MSRIALGGFLLAGVLACSTEPLAPKPLDITIEANRTTAAPGDTITFVANAQGGNLIGVEVDYGDSSTDLFSTSGARTARVTFRHAYQQRANYVVRAKVTDAIAGQKEVSLEVRVN